MTVSEYSPLRETQRIFERLCGLKDELALPADIDARAKDVEFTTEKDTVYFPIPLKETETASALKAIEALVAASLANLKYGSRPRKININLEHATCFLFQAYLSTIDGLGKYDQGVRAKLKGQSFGARGWMLKFADSYRYRLSRSTVEPIPSHVRKPLRDKDSWGILSHSWIA